MKTIKQIADEIGVSKQAVQQRIDKPPLVDTAKPLLVMLGGAWRVPIEAETLILKAFSEEPTSKSTSDTDKLGDKQPTSVGEELVGLLREQLAIKDKQIGELTAALENTTASLKAAQALHAGTMHKQLSENSTEEEMIPPDPAETGNFNKLFEENSTPLKTEPGTTQETADPSPEKQPGLFARLFSRKK